jgi:uroporphyrinogen III methyltransferase/synthase
VFFVGAGPGDPGLLTARALELIASADVILYDRLIPDTALAGARHDAELIYVGKEGGGPSVDQDEIERALIKHARAGSVVVRLKGGDPFVFGRGGEEALGLRAAGIDFEVVPGVTAGVAAAAYAGIPVTHRGLASAVALITAHEDPAKDEPVLDWPAIAAFPGTLVFYMGVRQLARLAERLIAAGRSAAEPAAIIERGTLPDQRAIIATLATVGEIEGVRAPAVVVVGQVAGLSQGLTWYQRGPLAGRVVAVTRARAQASELAARLRSLGARVIETPAIRIQPREVTLPSLADFDLLCLTSANGVELLFARLDEQGLDARALAGLRVAAIGPGTATALRAHGVIADVVPERFVAEGLLEALATLGGVRRVLLARAADARDVLVEGLRARGAEVLVVALYDTVAEPIDATTAASIAQSADYVTFTSSSTVRFLLEQVRPGPQTRLVSIGPVTSDALRERGLEPHVEAARHDIDGLVEALIADATLPATAPP